MKKYALRWTQAARDDLKSVFTYICKTDGKRQAQSVVSGIRQQALKVTILPDLHAREPKAKEENNIRFTVKWRYKLIFKVERDTVYIIRIFHTAQDPDKLTLDS